MVGMLSDRRHTRLISEFGGLKNVMPRFTAAFLIITLASIGMPGLNGFIGEFLIMLGAFRWDWRFVVGAGLGVILSAVYMLWMFQRVFYGDVTHEENATLPDLRRASGRAVLPLCAMALFMGIFPTVFLRPMEPAVERLVERLQSAQSLRVDHGPDRGAPPHRARSARWGPRAEASALRSRQARRRRAGASVPAARLSIQDAVTHVQLLL